MLGPDGARGLRVLDLYAGTGAFGIEALSRGAAWAEFVEIDERRCRDIGQALRALNFKERGRVHKGDVVRVASRLEGAFDLVFADPPYGDNPFQILLAVLQSRGLVAEKAVIFLEHPARLELPVELPGVRQMDTRKYGDAAVSVYRRAP
jgi:16S rRNA (guanine966-N2)-methyltransferase